MEEKIQEMLDHATHVVKNSLGYEWEQRRSGKWFVRESDTSIDITYSPKNFRMYLTVRNKPLGMSKTFPQLMEGNWRWSAVRNFIQDCQIGEWERDRAVKYKANWGADSTWKR